MTARNLLLLASVTLVVAAQTVGANEQEPTVYQQARQVYESAMTMYTSGRYAQAQGLLEEFVKKFATHEAVPVAYLQLAECRKLGKNQASYDEAIEAVIRRFPGSWYWFMAYNDKLSRLKAQKKTDEYLAAVEAMLKIYKEVPAGLASVGFGGPRQKSTPHWDWGFWTLESQIVGMCDTPERAATALSILAPTFRKYAGELPLQVQMDHVQLLKLAGKDAEANKAMASYQGGRSSLGFLLFHGKLAQDKRDDKTADPIFDQIFKDYGDYGSMATHMYDRLAYLRARGRADDCVALAREYLEKFPHADNSRDVVGILVSILGKRAVAGDDEAGKEARTLVNKYHGKDSYSALQWQISQALDANKPDEAVPLAERLLGDSYWSARTFSLLEGYAKRAPSLAAVVGQARKKYTIPVGDANSPAALAYKDLQKRIKDNQLRFMEEIAAAMVNEHPDDAATIEAVKSLADYYYAKALVEPRDKWMDYMIDRYRRHPLTEPVMVTRAMILMVDKKYAKAAEIMDQAMERFPTSAGLPRTWHSQRIACYRAANDPNGLKAYVIKLNEPAARTGDLHAMSQVAALEDDGDSNNPSKLMGDWWVEQASRFPGTHTEIQCNYSALNCYYLNTRALRGRACWKEANEVIAMLHEQKVDPEMKSRMEFMAVGMLLDKGESKAAIELFTKRLTAKKYYNITTRVDIDDLRRAILVPAARQAGAQLLDRLDAVSYTRRDRRELDLLRADLLVATKAPAEGVRLYLKVIDESPWPASELLTFQSAFKAAGGDVGQSALMIDNYVAKIKSVQDVVPGLYAELAARQAAAKDGAGLLATLNKLAETYPASSARAQVEAMVAAPAKPKAKAAKP